MLPKWAGEGVGCSNKNALNYSIRGKLFRKNGYKVLVRFIPDLITPFTAANNSPCPSTDPTKPTKQKN